MSPGMITAACAYYRVTKKQAFNIVLASIVRRLNVARVGEGVKCESISSELARIRTTPQFRKNMIAVGKDLSGLGIDIKDQADLNISYLLEAFQEISPTFGEYYDESSNASSKQEVEGLVDDNMIDSVFTEVGVWLGGDPGGEGDPMRELLDRNPVVRLLHKVDSSIKEQPIEQLFFELQSPKLEKEAQ